MTRGKAQDHMAIRALVLSGVVFTGAIVHATQAPAPAPVSPPQQSAAPTAKPEDGIPVTDQVVLKACGTCHRPDDKSQMSRISFQRNTPEGWQNTIQRMAALNGLNIDAATARHVVKYLATNHGLAPEEARPAAWEVEKRWLDFKYPANADAESDLQQVSFAGPRHLATANARRVGVADRDASWLVSAGRQPGVPPRRSGAARPFRRRQAARHASPC